MPKLQNEVEKRSFGKVELRAKPDFIVEGIAAPFGVESSDLGGFVEQCAPGSFARSLREVAAGKRDVKALTNHDPSQLLGRTKNKTLVLKETERGLWFRVRLDPSISFHRDLYRMVQNQTLDACSFAFKVPAGGDVWVDPDGVRAGKKQLRLLTDCDLYDVSIVTSPAYSQGTSVDARSAAATHNVAALRAVSETAARRKWREQMDRTIRVGKRMLRDLKDDEDEWEIDEERARRELQNQLSERGNLQLVHVSSLDRDGNGHCYAIQDLSTRAEVIVWRYDWSAEPDEDVDSPYWYRAMLAEGRKLTPYEVSSLDGRPREQIRMAEQEQALRLRMESAAGRTTR